MLVTTDRLLEWLEETINEGALVELTRNSKSFSCTLVNFGQVHTKAFEGTTLLHAIKSAWAEEISFKGNKAT